MECIGVSGTFMSTIRVASVGELIIILYILINIISSFHKFEDPPAAPSGIMTNKQFSKTGASITLTWSANRELTTSYTVNVTPATMLGQISDFTTTDTSLQLMLEYNVDYLINITAH